MWRARSPATVLAALALAACTQTPGTPPSQGLVAFRLPALNVTFGSDPVVTAVNSLASNLAVPRRMHGQPAVAAQVVGQYEFVTEALREPRFTQLSPLTQLQMERGRPALREAVGIAADAPPRLVIDRMAALAGALDRGDLGAAEAVLRQPLFVRPPAAVFATLEAMPAVPEAARAASFANQQLNQALQMSTD
jgi:hypothetical protein